MFLVFDKALIVRSTSGMLFFKVEPSTGLWTKFHTIDNIRGTIFFTRGNIRIQITTEKKIYFYLIDKETFMPELENVMYNFIECSSLMVGSKVKYAVAYKTSQQDYEIFTRNRYHNFKVCIDATSFEGAVGCTLESIGAYALAEKLKIGIYDESSFEEKQSLTIAPDPDSLCPTEAEVLYMQTSQDLERLGVIIGKQKRDKVEISEIVIYAKDGAEYTLLK